MSSKRSAEPLQLLQPRHVALPLGHRQVGQGHRIEVIVREGDKAEATTAQFRNFCHDVVDGALPRLLSIRPPHRAERTMLRTAADRLHRPPHVTSIRQQVPPRWHEAIGIDASALVDPLQRAVDRVLEHDRPDDIAIAADDGVCAPELMRLIRK